MRKMAELRYSTPIDLGKLSTETEFQGVSYQRELRFRRDLGVCLTKNALH
jgi:hypothetical protein